MDNLFVCLGDLNGHMGWHVDGGCGVGQCNFKEFCQSFTRKKICVKYMA